MPFRGHPQQHFEEFDGGCAVCCRLEALQSWQRLRISLQTPLDRFEDLVAPPRALETLWERPKVAQALDRRRRLHRNVANHLVLDDSSPRDVASLSFAFAPCSDLHQYGQLLWLPYAAFESLPCPLRIGAIGLRRGKHFHLGFDPVAALPFFQVGGKIHINISQMGYV